MHRTRASCHRTAGGAGATFELSGLVSGASLVNEETHAECMMLGTLLILTCFNHLGVGEALELTVSECS